MRKIIAAVLIFLSVITYSQWSNTFSKENEEVLTSNPKEGEPEPGRADYLDQSGELDDENPANPGDPVPVDDYIPLLLIIAAGLIAYKMYGRKQLLK